MHLFNVPLNHHLTPRGMGDNSRALSVSAIEFIFTLSHTLSSRSLLCYTLHVMPLLAFWWVSSSVLSKTMSLTSFTEPATSPRPRHFGSRITTWYYPLRQL